MNNLFVNLLIIFLLIIFFNNLFVNLLIIIFEFQRSEVMNNLFVNRKHDYVLTCLEKGINFGRTLIALSNSHLEAVSFSSFNSFKA